MRTSCQSAPACGKPLTTCSDATDWRHEGQPATSCLSGVETLSAVTACVRVGVLDFVHRCCQCPVCHGCCTLRNSGGLHQLTNMHSSCCAGWLAAKKTTDQSRPGSAADYSVATPRRLARRFGRHTLLAGSMGDWAPVMGALQTTTSHTHTYMPGDPHTLQGVHAETHAQTGCKHSHRHDKHAARATQTGALPELPRHAPGPVYIQSVTGTPAAAAATTARTANSLPPA